MGAVGCDIPLPYAALMRKNLTLRGQFMYEREHMWGLIKLAESGALKLGKAGGQEVVGEFGLDEIYKAFETAQANSGTGQIVVLKS